MRAICARQGPSGRNRASPVERPSETWVQVSPSVRLGGVWQESWRNRGLLLAAAVSGSHPALIEQPGAGRTLVRDEAHVGGRQNGLALASVGLVVIRASIEFDGFGRPGLPRPSNRMP